LRMKYDLRRALSVKLSSEIADTLGGSRLDARTRCDDADSQSSVTQRYLSQIHSLVSL
jgi:hypothetical protein